jgi:hypothetical protein
MNMARFLVAAALGGCACLAQAGFVNGGFEDGTLNGWTVRYGDNYSGNGLGGITWGSWDYGSYGTAARVVGTHVDAYNPAFNNPFNGSYMALLNDDQGMYHVTQIYQDGTITAADLADGAVTADLYINWAGVLDDPGHYGGRDPWFDITVTRNGSVFGNEMHYATDPGWTQSAVRNSGTWDYMWYKSGQYHLSGLNVGDVIGVQLTVADCAWGGHGGYAYLDGIGTSYVPPPDVPDGGTTMALLGLSLSGIGLLRRKMRQA